MNFSSNMIGYTGYASIDSLPILCTGGSASVQNSIMYTNGIWGAGYNNGFRNVCFALDYPILNIQLSFDLTSKGNLFTKLGEWSTTKRNIAKSIKIIPDGVTGYDGNSYCQSITFETSQDSLVTGNISAKSYSFDKAEETEGDNVENGEKTENGKGDNSLILQMTNTYQSVYPYWGTYLIINNKEVKDLISWSITQSTSIIFAKCCTNEIGNDSSFLPVADYVAFGMLEGEGNYSCLTKNDDSFNQMCSNNSINLCSVDNIKNSISIKLIQRKSHNINIQTGNSLVQRDYNFTVIGNGEKEVIKIS